MRYEVIPIQTEYSDLDAKFEAYILDSSKEFQPDLIRPMIILCPGGGFAGISDREAEPIAMRFLAYGYHVGILRYSVAPACFPAALVELSEVMKLVHVNDVKWHVDSKQIYVHGFSAGGHLAASLGVYWDKPFLYEKVETAPETLRPAGIILSYPVITTKKRYMHEGSFRNLLGERYEELKKKLSIEKLVTSKMPPCFIWHTFTDDTVPVENSLLLAKALCKAGVSTELHIYPVGGHGLSLADESTSRADGGTVCEPVQSWMELLQVWLKNRTKDVELQTAEENEDE